MKIIIEGNFFWWNGIMFVILHLGKNEILNNENDIEIEK